MNTLLAVDLHLCERRGRLRVGGVLACLEKALQQRNLDKGLPH